MLLSLSRHAYRPHRIGPAQLHILRFLPRPVPRLPRSPPPPRFPRNLLPLYPNGRRARTKVPMAGRCAHPDDIRPNPTLGTYYLVPHGHSGSRTGPDLRMLASYRFPPSTHRLPGVLPVQSCPFATFAPGTIIGPVVGVDHTSLCTSVLVHHRWVTVWSGHNKTMPSGITYLIGTHHLRPIPPAQLSRFWQTYPHHPIDPARAPWNHPFEDLWRYAQEISLSHVSGLTFDTPPRFLLTGPVWRYLHDLQARHRPGPPLTDAHLRTWGLSLHPRLDYPALGGLAWPLPTEPLNEYQWAEIIPRALIVAHLRMWVHSRRRRRAKERRRLIYAERILPPHIMGLTHVIRFISECL